MPHVMSKGHQLLDITGRVSPTETTHIGSGDYPGLCPFRVVILDPAATVGKVGDASMPPVKYPGTTYAAGDVLHGVCIGPENTLPNEVFDAWYNPILPGRSCDIRIAGVAPMITDTTTSGTPIVQGRLLKSSTTANQDGLAAAAALTGGSSAPSANQHIIGMAWNPVAIANGVVLVHLRLQEV